jgi:hypothetical protein
VTERPDDSRAFRSTSRLFAGQVLAVTAIAIVLTAVGVLVKGDDTAETRTAEPASSASPAPDPASAPDGSTSPAPTTPTSTSAPESPTEVVGTPAEDRPQVDVVNQSAPRGSAEETADAIEMIGWRIGRVDNFRGNVRTTTVYYFPGDQKHAEALEADLPGRQRVLEAFDTLVEGRLSIVLVEPIH